MAAQNIWERYFSQLVAVAESRLRKMPRESSGEDVALSAMKSAMLGIQKDNFPLLTDRTSLWPLLVTLTARKSIDEVRRQLAKKRSVSDTTSIENSLIQVVGKTPSPTFAVEVADQMERLVTMFDEPALRTIAVRKLEGYSHEEIAAELSMSKRTVIRKLNLIRQEWEESEETP